MTNLNLIITLKHSVDTQDDLIGATGHVVCLHRGNHEPGKLDRKQNHARFDYYGYDGVKFSFASYAQSSVVQESLDFKLQYSTKFYSG